MSSIDLVFVTYNRLDYTQRALDSILADPDEEFSLYIWDNASSDGTAEYLKERAQDKRIVDLILSNENVGQAEAVNRIWSNSQADLLGKLDNDCLVTAGWTRILAQAHQDIPQLGVVACWPFYEDDFDAQRADHKIQTFGQHRIFRHPWTCGTGLLLKREVYRKLGPMGGETTNAYWLKMAASGYINGFYYPLVYQDHMDDPKSKYCQIRDEQSFEQAAEVTVGLQAGRYNDMAGRMKWRQEILRNLHDDSFELSYYLGWRKYYRRLREKLRRFL